MFYSAVLQPEDSEKQLKTLGLRLKFKKKEVFLPQPCPAFRAQCCSIYEFRPQRCRLFNCRQLLGMESGEINFNQALDTIAETRALSDRVQSLLLEAGSTNLSRSLRTRYELALAQPLDPKLDPQAWSIRQRLVETMEELEARLALDFRV